MTTFLLLRVKVNNCVLSQEKNTSIKINLLLLHSKFTVEKTLNNLRCSNSSVSLSKITKKKKHWNEDFIATSLITHNNSLVTLFFFWTLMHLLLFPTPVSLPALQHVHREPENSLYMKHWCRQWTYCRKYTDKKNILCNESFSTVWLMT